MYNVITKVKNERIINRDKLGSVVHSYEYVLSKISTNDLLKYYIINPESFFSEAGTHLSAMCNIESHIPADVLDLLIEKKCLLIIDLSYEATGLGNTTVQQRENNKNSHIIDVYTEIRDFAKKHDILHHVRFLSMMENGNWYVNEFFEDPSLFVWECPSIPMRYRKFRIEDYAELLNTPGPEKNAIWLNRRIRDHRVNLITQCVDRNIDFDNMHFSFIGSKFESFEPVDLEHDSLAIRNTRYITDENKNKVLDLFGRIVGLDETKTTEEMHQWLGASDIGRVVEMLKQRSNAAYEIVSEFTHNDIGIHFSEKFTLPILSKKPFVISGDRYIIRELNKLGFKTFNEFWSEDYDNYTENHTDLTLRTRTEMLSNTIKEIEDTFHTDENYTRDEYGNVLYCEKMQEILDHNYEHFINVYSENLMDNWCKVFAIHNHYTPVKGLHPVEVAQQVEKDETWEDAVWYKASSNHFFIPIWRNGNTFFMNRIAERLGYQLVKKQDIDNWEEVPAYAFVRHPNKRIAGQYWRACVNNGVTFDDLKNSDDWSKLDMHFVSQYEFLKDFNVVHCIDLDNPLSVNRKIIKTDVDANNRISDDINDVITIMLSDRKERNAIDHKFATNITQELKNKWFTDKHEKQYAKDYKLYFDNADWKLRGRNHQSDNPIYDHVAGYFENNPGILESCIEAVDETHHTYLKSNDRDYWSTHATFLSNASLDNAPKDIDILDLGTHFGFLHKILNDYGFENVESCNSEVEANDTTGYLNKVWDLLGINTPFEKTISVNKEFTLPRKYDMIIIARTNMFWLMEDVLCYSNGNLNRSYQVTDKQDVVKTFFTVYNLDQFKFFEENIKKFLKPGGFAIVQPEPFVYNQYPERYIKELKWLKERQQRGYEKLTANRHYPVSHLNDYFIITNDKDYTE